MLILPETLELFPEPLPATVTEPISKEQNGRVRFQDSQWPAAIYITQKSICLLPGTPVQVIGRKGLTLLIAVL